MGVVVEAASMNFLMFSLTKVWWLIWSVQSASSPVSGRSPETSSQATSRKLTRSASSWIG